MNEMRSEKETGKSGGDDQLDSLGSFGIHAPHRALSSTESGPAANGFLKFDELGLIGIELERDLNFRCGFVLMAKREFGAGQQVMRLGITGRDLDGGAEKFRG